MKFTASSHATGEDETFPLELDGVYEDKTHDPPTWSETFHIRKFYDAGALDASLDVWFIRDGMQFINTAKMLRALKSLMTQGSQLRFQMLLDDPARLVDPEPMRDVFDGVWAAVTERPTRPSLPSSNGMTDSPTTPPPSSPPQETPTPTDTSPPSADRLSTDS